MADFDLIIIGAGPGGYVAAIRASQLGMKVACIEKEATLGGTCLNIGCIPSKALLNSSEKFIEFKNKIVKQLTARISFLYKKNKITHLSGTASFIDKQTIKVQSSKELTLSAKNFIIATGSSSMERPGINVDEKQITPISVLLGASNSNLILLVLIDE